MKARKQQQKSHVRNTGELVTLSPDCDFHIEHPDRTFDFAEFNITMQGMVCRRCDAVRIYQPREYRFRCPGCEPFTSGL